ncbi:MAG: hypothetical protein JWR19_4175 [Pedosphaera sp.]|nr:hypothetical protein [Pedosphaera sp.]
MSLGKSRAFEFGVRSAELGEMRAGRAARCAEVMGGMWWAVPGALPQAVLLRAFSAGESAEQLSWSRWSLKIKVDLRWVKVI